MSKDNSVKKDINLHSAVASYMLLGKKTEINNILRKLGKILPKIGIAKALLAILRQECGNENFDILDFDLDTHEFFEKNKHICNILVIDIKIIVIAYEISEEKIKKIEELIGTNL